MAKFEFDFHNCTDDFRKEMASGIAEYDEEESSFVCSIVYPKKLAVDLFAFPPSKENIPNRWDYAFWCADWDEYGGWIGTYAEEILGYEPVVDIDWLDNNWEDKAKEILIMVWNTVEAKKNEDKEYEIYKKIQRENDLDDAQSIYEDLWEKGMPMNLPENVAEQIVENFRHWHDWTVSDYDQLKGYVEEAMENLKPKGTSFHDDVDKMIDFFHLSREDFLERYDYLTEADYDATIEAVRQQCDIKETVVEGVALYALIMLRDYKSED